MPILAVTLWSARYGDDQLRALAAQLRDAIAEVTDVSEVTLIGGRPRQVRVDIDPARLAAYGLDPLAVQRRSPRTNARGDRVRARSRADGSTGLEAGDRLRDRRRRAPRRRQRRAAGAPCSCATWPTVVDGDAEPTSYVTFQSTRRPARTRPSPSPSPSARAPTPSTSPTA